MKLPIRLRVALYVTLTFAVVIIGLSLVLTELYERYSYRSFDVTLEAAATSIANRIGEDGERIRLHGLGEDISETISTFENKLGLIHVGIFDPSGKEIFSLHDDGGIASQVRAEPGRRFKSVWKKGKKYRAAISHVEAGDQQSGSARQGTVVALASLSATRESIDRIDSLAFIIAPITILLVGIGSVLIARRALYPLERMALDIDSIRVDRPLAKLEVPRTSDEIQRVAESFNALILRIMSLIDSQRNFLLDASHELKTPLTVIQTEIEMLQMKPSLTSEERDNLQQLLSEVEYASKLAIDLIYLSRLESSAISNLSPQDLDAMVKEVLSHQSPIAAHKEIRFHASLSGRCTVNADPELLKRVLSNVLENAVKYSGRGSEIMVTTEVDPQSSRAIVEITDHGQGISEEELPRVFDRFYRTKGARSGDEKGSGLGLSIAKRIVEEHGGKITLASKRGEGTVVKIELQASVGQGTSIDA